MINKREGVVKREITEKRVSGVPRAQTYTEVLYVT